MKLESPLLLDFGFIILLHIFLLPSSSLTTSRWLTCFLCFVTLFSTLHSSLVLPFAFSMQVLSNLYAWSKGYTCLLIFSKHQKIIWIGITNLLTHGTGIYWVRWVLDYLIVFTFIYLYVDNSGNIKSLQSNITLYIV